VNGTEHPDCAGSLSCLSRLFLAQGDYDQAETHILNAFSIYEKTLGTSHYITIRTIESIIDLYHTMGDVDSEEMYKTKLGGLTGE
jgi:hypothetical protein